MRANFTNSVYFVLPHAVIIGLEGIIEPVLPQPDGHQVGAGLTGSVNARLGQVNINLSAKGLLDPEFHQLLDELIDLAIERHSRRRRNTAR